MIIADLCRAWIDDPTDPVRRLVLADALEEAGDCRHELLRLGNLLLQAQDRPVLPCELRAQANGRMTTSRQDWPLLDRPMPAGAQKGPRESWRRVSAIGRLVSCAFLRAARGEQMISWQVAAELYACQLLGPRMAQQFKARDSSIRDLCFQSGFAGFQSMADHLTGEVGIKEKMGHDEWLLARLHRQAELYSRFMGMMARLDEIQPWVNMRMARGMEAFLK